MHFALLLALIKSDYFQRNGFRIDAPTIAECVAKANRGHSTVEELKALLQQVPADNNIIYNVIQSMAQIR
jgi:hypothetical protein